MFALPPVLSAFYLLLNLGYSFHRVHYSPYLHWHEIKVSPWPMKFRAIHLLNGLTQLNSATCSTLGTILRKVFDSQYNFSLLYNVLKILSKEDVSSNISSLPHTHIHTHIIINQHLVKPFAHLLCFMSLCQMNLQMEYKLQKPFNPVMHLHWFLQRVLPPPK